MLVKTEQKEGERGLKEQHTYIFDPKYFFSTQQETIYTDYITDSTRV